MEWENVRLCGHERVFLVLQTLVQQLQELRHELRSEPELVITYKASTIAPDALSALLDRSAGGHPWPCRLRFLPVDDDDGYYDQKNRGAAAAGNDIILFLDSDVLPQHGWLRSMLTPFLQWNVAALAGSTSVDLSSLYGRATALYWLLPPPPARAGVQALQAYFANNLAFRRSLFLQVPFPSSNAYRGQCAAQLRLLTAAGIVVLQQTDALTLHPPPPGISGFVERAWHAGTGAWHHLSEDDQASLTLPCRALLADTHLLARRIRERAPVLRAKPRDRAAGWVLGGLYFLIKAAGHLFTAARGRLRTGARSAGPRLPSPNPYTAGSR